MKTKAPVIFLGDVEFETGDDLLDFYFLQGLTIKEGQEPIFNGISNALNGVQWNHWTMEHDGDEYLLVKMAKPKELEPGPDQPLQGKPPCDNTGCGNA